MTNGEIRMTNQTANANDETHALPAFHSSLPFRHSFVIRASDFVIV